MTKVLIKLILLSIVLMKLTSVFGLETKLEIENTKMTDHLQNLHYTVVELYYKNRKQMSTSNLGTILYKNVDRRLFENKARQSKMYTIVIWMFWTEIVSTFLHTANFDSQTVTDKILENCSVKNCKYFSSYYTDTDVADAVIFMMSKNIVPKNPTRDSRQRWILWSHGSLMHKTGKWTDKGMAAISGIFNWTMNYRSDADIPVPYGRTVPRAVHIDVNLNNPYAALMELVPFWSEKQSNVLVMGLTSDCKWQYSLFTDEMKVDIYWKSCPRESLKDCTLPEKYLFLLAFEDSSCRQYITEIIFYLALTKGAIPVIMGPPVEDCEKLLPPHSFLHVENYQNISHLVRHIKEISEDQVKLLSFHIWRQHFDIVNEHGVYNNTSYHLCRVCEALNYNDGESSVYYADDLYLFYNEKLFCDVEYKCKTG